jgi:hypothetical protein
MSRAITSFIACLGVATAVVGCDDESSGATSSGTGGTTTSSSTTTSSTGTGGDGGSGASQGGGAQGGGGEGGSAQGGGSAGAIPGGGTILFQEHFDDANFSNRDWYDGATGTISSTEHVSGGGSFECAFANGAQSCSGGKPARHLFTANETVYMSMYLKFSSNWVGSGVAYHPHMFHFINDLESDWVGPSHTRLTTYMEVVNGRAMLALQDGVNVDTNCVLLNNDTFVGCNGDFNTYTFTENRSVCSCNGLMGDLDGRDCFSSGGNTYYSSRAWRTPGEVFTDTAGQYDKTDWHFVEVYFEMNSINNGVGVADGKIRWVQDDEVLISYDHILMRTNEHATMAFDQFAMLPYIGPGSPIAQSFFVDEMTVATARP